MQSIEFAFVKTVAAYHAARIIHLPFFEVDGLSLAILLAHAAVLALVLVEADAKQGET